MSRTIDLIHKRFGRLLVISRSTTDAHGNAMWRCICDCGNLCSVRSYHLRKDMIKSCGCLQKEIAAKRLKTHGQWGSKLYHVWAAMKKRCNNIADIGYHNYGGRGITVCDEWNIFQNFHQWAINNKYKEGLSIERIDNDGNYSPENCRWATKKEQNRNSRQNLIVYIDGKEYRMWELIKITGLKYETIRKRIKRGDTGKDIIRKLGAEKDENRKKN